MAKNLGEALAAYLAGNATIQETFPGGVHGDEATRDTEALPYLVITQSTLSTQRLCKPGWELVTFLVELTVVASGKEITADAAALLRPLILKMPGNPALPTLAFDDGRDVNRQPGGDDSFRIDETRGPDNTDVWRYTTPIHWTISRGS